MKVAAGAGVAGAVTGLVLAGPVGAVVAGGVAVAAATRRDEIGDVARAAGKTTIKAYEKVKEVNEEHKVTQKVCAATNSAIRKAREIDEEYKVRDHVQDAAVKIGQTGKHVFDKAVEIEREHKLGEKAQQAAKTLGAQAKEAFRETQRFEQKHQIGAKIGSALSSFGKKIAGSGGASNQQNQAQESIPVAVPVDDFYSRGGSTGKSNR